MSVKVHGEPPLWFWDIYDAIKMGVPVHEGQSIRQIPLYVRYRHRLVKEAITAAKYHQAKEGKVQPMIDIGGV